MPTVTQISKNNSLWNRKNTIPPKAFTEVDLNSDKYGFIDKSDESISSTTIGTLVDLASRFFILKQNNVLKNAFNGANIKDLHGFTSDSVEKYNRDIKYLNKRQDKSLPELSKDDYNVMLDMALFEGIFRSGVIGSESETEEINDNTYEHLTIFMQRCKNFVDKYGPFNRTGFGVKSNDKNVWGDGDYLGNNTLADLKLYVQSPLKSTRNRRQILIYYLLGKRSDDYPEFQTINKLVFFNPRTDKAYELKTAMVTSELESEVMKIIDSF